MVEHNECGKEGWILNLHLRWEEKCWNKLKKPFTLHSTSRFTRSFAFRLYICQHQPRSQRGNLSKKHTNKTSKAKQNKLYFTREIN
ncbi:Hypothetical predicted protein [Podarcis lilfordi]|uniref:Uncharacterized protein n=1 Tax=Podarcis lilfordi TaxID=74358 RepID=A0AA35NU92_9SAUR|nr:Hypothetical predicted protein [Podarcis lilfordi]